MAFGVTEEMIEGFGDIIFELSLNIQVRAGDPVRVLDLAAIDGLEPLTERALRDVVRYERWTEQRAAWARLRP